MVKNKNLSNPASTGGAGGHFEAHVQASFVALMLTGGHAPCLNCWPITEIGFQNKVDDLRTDDISVIVEDANSEEQQKLIGHIKYSINITQSSTVFGEVIQSAWNDFNDAEVFKKGKDVIALITGPLSKTDVRDVRWLLDQARYTKNAEEFFKHVKRKKFSSVNKKKKFKVIRHHIKVANGNKDVSDKELYEFLKHFYLLGYDLGNEYGVVLSLLHSHISQFQQQDPQNIWARVVDIVQTWNQGAGTITRETLPYNILKTFKEKAAVVEMPEKFKLAQESSKIDWVKHPDATHLALAVLIGAWQDKNQYDIDAIAQLLDISYDEWIKNARKILRYSDSPLSHKNGVWKIINRTELWDQLGMCIFDQNLDTFKSLALSVLKEPDPAFEMPAEERYMASIQGKVMKRSHVLRKGIAEGLAILGTRPDACSNCSKRKVEETCGQVIRTLLADADHVLWGSMDSLLPTLAEVAPGEFLDEIEKAMGMTPCLFKKLFPQEGNGITSNNYLTGLLCALEGIAWDEKQLVRVCVILGELASHDPGGHRANRPSNSLATILMPWLPQTLASASKRNVAVRTMFNECPDIAWNLLIQLLPNQNQISSRTHTPIWRKLIPHDWKAIVTTKEYQQQISFYVELAVDKAGQNADRISKLIYYFDDLSKPDLNKILPSLASQSILELPEEQRISIWEHLTRFAKKHRRFSYTEWALPNDMITRIEQVAEKLVPKELFNLYQYLFSDNDFDFYDNDNWEEQEEKFNMKRENAISKIFQQSGVEGVIQFAETVSSPHHVGQALSVITDTVIERTLLPHFLDKSDNKHKALVGNFIWSNHFKKSWEWSNNIDKSVWTSAQIGQFLAYLPFTNEAWERASEWLQREESEYWTRTSANAYNYGDGDFAIAIGKLIENDRPRAAINCLYRMHRSKQIIDTNQCIRVLRAAFSSSEPSHTLKEYYIVELIKFLQTNPSVNQDDLCQVEWEYLSLPDYHRGVALRTLERKLANDPKFFCDVIQLVCRSESTNESKAAWRLLHGWKRPPGIQEDRTLSEESFAEWLQNVKAACVESDHLEVALNNIGKVLIYAPQDPKGLWIHCAVAKELNDRENDEMREGFRTGWYNSRGVHSVDPTGKSEKKLAEQFQNKADEVENAGFHRIASTLKDLAAGYDREAKKDN